MRLIDIIKTSNARNEEKIYYLNLKNVIGGIGDDH